MRGLGFFQCLVIFGASLLTWNAIAEGSPTRAAPLKVHLMENLDSAELKVALKELRRLGYRPTHSPLFTESDHAVIITKTLSDTDQTESLSFEVVRMKKHDPMPRSIFELKTKEKSLEALFKNAPRSERVENDFEVLQPIAAAN